MADSDFLSLIERYPSVRVLCAGDVMLDRFVYGDVTRISPEAPIPVVAVREELVMLGGAGNAARNISALGAGVDFLTVTGDDAAGAEIASAVKALPNCAGRIIRDPTRRSSLKVRYLSHQQQILRVDTESTAPLADKYFVEVADQFRNALAACEIVLLSDYAKGMLAGHRAAALIEMCREAGKPVFVDPKGEDFGRYRGATLLKPNLAELHATTRMPVNTAAETEAAARALVDSAGVDAVLVTRGPAGMMLIRPDAPVFEVSGHAREIFDVSGAGDTAAANLAVAFAAGATLETSVRLANIAAGLVVSKLGTATVSREQLAWELESDQKLTSGGRVRDYEAAMDQVLKWRRAGLRVGAIAGKFDLPQAELLGRVRDARAQCDKLVVAVIADPADVGRGGADACDLLSALVWVDLVVPCSEDLAARFTENTFPENTLTANHPLKG